MILGVLSIMTKWIKALTLPKLGAGVEPEMGVPGPDRAIDTESEESRPSYKYYRPSATGGLGGPMEETEGWWWGRVRFWLVGGDGKARAGEYSPGIGVRDLVQ